MIINKNISQLFKKTAYALNRIIVSRDTLWATPEHKFFIAAKGWVQAAGLTAGMLMQSQVGTATINSNVAIDTAAEVYNFTVENNHTYYVGKGTLLTHNECGPLGDLLRSLGDKQGDFLKHFGDNTAANNFIKNKFAKGELNIETWEALVAVGVTNGDWLAMCNKLGNKWNKALVNKLASDLAANPNFKAFFNAASGEKRAKLLNAYKHLAEINGSTKQWIKTNTALLAKLEGKTDDYIEKVKIYYSNHQKPSSSGTPPFIHQGTQFDILGHPNFVPEIPLMDGIGKIKYNPNDINNLPKLNGTITDMNRANAWADGVYNVNGQNRFLDLGNGRCKIKKQNNEWVECVWHHHEDAKTMIPVPIETHNRAFVTGSPHTGGGAILNDKKNGLEVLIGFFNSPSGL